MINSFIVFPQTSVRVADLSFKMKSNSTEEFYYSFAEGDVMVVDFELRKGKGVKIEVIELPYQTKINQFTARISNYRMNVTSTKVYLFRVTNGMGNKLCSLGIKRIPKSQETVNFNTAWQWKTIYDTTYTTYKEDSLVRHDTLHYTETVKEVISKETSDVELVNISVQVHSIGIIDHDNPHTFIKVELPKNYVFDNVEQRVYGWAWWIGVTSRNHQVLGRILKEIPSLPGILDIKKFLLGTVVDLVIPEGTDNIHWYIVNNGSDVNAFMRGQSFSCIAKNFGSGAYSKYIDKNTQGTFYICLYNEYSHSQVTVKVQAVAIIETITYKDVDYQRTKVVPQYVTLTKQRMNITSSQVRVPLEDIK